MKRNVHPTKERADQWGDPIVELTERSFCGQQSEAGFSLAFDWLISHDGSDPPEELLTLVAFFASVFYFNFKTLQGSLFWALGSDLPG